MSNSNTYQPERLLPIGEVARLAGVTVPTIRNWERDGKITALRTPKNHRRFRQSEVEALIHRGAA